MREGTANRLRQLCPLLPFLAVNRGKGVGRAAVQAARLIHLI
jgi:hypothetical protein